MKILLFFSFLLLGILPLHASTITITTFDNNADGIGNGWGADTTVYENSPNDPGPTDAIKVRTNLSIQLLSIGYLRFDLSQIVGTISEARLCLYDYRFNEAPASGHTYSIYGLTSQSEDYWSESALTWNTAPGITPDGVPYNGPDFNSNVVHLGSFNFTASGNAGFSVPISLTGLTAFVQGDANKLVTLMIYHIQDGSQTLFYFAGKESDHYTRLSSTTVPIGSLAPQLILDGNVAFVPEPGVLFLFALGMIVIFLRHRG